MVCLNLVILWLLFKSETLWVFGLNTRNPAIYYIISLLTLRMIGGRISTTRIMPVQMSLVKILILILHQFCCGMSLLLLIFMDP